MIKEYIVRCVDCNKEFYMPKRTYYSTRRRNIKRGIDKNTFRCKECMSKWRSEKVKKEWSEKSEKEKQSRRDFLKEQCDKYYGTRTEEQRIQHNTNIKNSELRTFHPELKEDYEKQKSQIILQKRIAAGKRQWENKSPEEIELYRQRGRDQWNNKSDKEKDIERECMRVRSLSTWTNMSDEDKKMFSEKCRDFWANVSSEYKEINKQRSIDWWNKLLEEDCRWVLDLHNVIDDTFVTNAKIMRTRLTNRNKISSFTQHFIDEFGSCCSEYVIVPEIPSINDKVFHMWDFGVYKNYKLECLVDLDGEYYHGDSCDYNGLQSHEEYDERRGYSLIDGVKWLIINDNNFDKGILYLSKILRLTYDEFLELRYEEYTNMPFPYPEYSNKELIKSYFDLCKINLDDLSINTRIGDRLVYHFHRCMWGESIDGLLSPIEIWKNPKSLIQEHRIFNTFLNKNKILQGLRLSNISRAKTFISPAKYKIIIHKYLNDYEEIFTPNDPEGAIILATVSLNKTFAGHITHETKVMISYLEMMASIKINDAPRHDCLISETDDIDEILNTFKCKTYIFITCTPGEHDVIDELPYENKKIIKIYRE